MTFELAKPDELRRGQLAALKELDNRLRRHVELMGAPEKLNPEHQSTALSLPCRYGKSDVMRLAAIKFKAEGLVSTTLVTSPAITLRDQFVDEARWREATDRYRITVPFKIRVNRIDHPKAGRLLRYNANDETCLSLTTQFADNNLDNLSDWVESEVHRTGLPMLMFVDECHTTSEGNEWGKLVFGLRAAGAHVCVVTASPERDDGKLIPGFRWDILSQEDVILYRCQPHEDPQKIWIEKLQGQKAKVRLRPNHETTLEDAWGETPSCLCKCSHTTFDLDLSDGRKLSEIASAAEIRRYLQDLRNPSAIEIAVTHFIERFRERRTQNPRWQAIIYCGKDIGEGSDNGDSENRHLRDVRNEIKRQWQFDEPLPRMVIATGSEGGADLVTSFAGNKTAPGDGDIVFLKQLGGMGQDFPWVKVIMDLSPTRTFSALYQRWFRGAQPWAETMVWDLITPADQLTERQYQRIVGSQGGDASITDLEMVDRWEKDRDPNDDDRALILGGEDGYFDDSDGRRAAPEELPEVTAVINRLPRMLTIYTRAEIAEGLRLSRVDNGENGEVAVQDVSKDADVERKKFNYEADEATNALRRYRGREQAPFGPDIKRVKGRIKKLADWPIGVTIRETDDVALLAHLARTAVMFREQKLWMQLP